MSSTLHARTARRMSTAVLALTFAAGVAGPAHADDGDRRHRGPATTNVKIVADPSAATSAESLDLAALSCGEISSDDQAAADELNPQLTANMAGYLTDYNIACARRVLEQVKARGFSQRTGEIAVSVIIVETSMQNLDGGDLDSVGLYQQRDFWGSYEERTDPYISTDLFLNEMVRIYPDGSQDAADPGTVAADVQRPAEEYRYRYTENMGDAVLITDRLW